MNTTNPSRSLPSSLKKREGNPEPVFVSLATFEPELAESKAAMAFWRELPRVPGRAPLKSDCDLLEIVDLLTGCLMIELEGPTSWPIRMFGSDLVTHFGIDATGFNGYDLYGPDEREDVAARLAIQRSRQAVMITQNRLRNAHDVALRSEWVFLPFASDDGDVDRLLVSIASFDQAPAYEDWELEGSLQDRRLLSLIYASDTAGEKQGPQ